MGRANEHHRPVDLAERFGLSARRKAMLTGAFVLACGLLIGVASAPVLGVLVTAGVVGVGLGGDVAGFRSAVLAAWGEGPNNSSRTRRKVQVVSAAGWMLIAIVITLFYVVVGPSLTR
jgi:hypothetical protein